MIGEQQVAAGNAHALDTRPGITRSRHAQAEGECVQPIPGDPRDIPVEQIVEDVLDIRKAHHLAVGRIGEARISGAGVLDLLQQEEVSALQDGGEVADQVNGNRSDR